MYVVHVTENIQDNSGFRKNIWNHGRLSESQYKFHEDGFKEKIQNFV